MPMIHSLPHSLPLRVAVVSIGRSGTSVISRILHEVLAIDFGDAADHIPPNFNNPDGYFENREMLELDELMLAAVGGGVLRPPAMNCFATLGEETRKNFIEAAREKLNFYAADKPRFGWKDPRLSLTFPIWKAATPNVIVVIAFRDPRAVMRSIADQLDVSPESLSGLWLEYYRRIFSDTADCPRVVVSFDQLLENPLRVVETIADFANIVIDKNDVERQLARIVKPKQPKHRASIEGSNLAFAPDLTLDPATEAVYFYLRDTINSGVQPDYAKLSALLELELKLDRQINQDAATNLAEHATSPAVSVTIAATVADAVTTIVATKALNQSWPVRLYQRLFGRVFEPKT